MWTYAQQPQIISQVLRDAVRLYKKSFAKMWYWHLILFLPMTLFSLANNYAGQTWPPFVLWGGVAVIALIYLFGECFLLYRIDGIARDGDSDARLGFMVAGKKFPWVVLLYFCSLLFIALSIFAIASLPVFTVASMGQLLSGGRLTLALELPVIIGLSLLLAYYFWFMAFIIMINIVNKNQKLLAAVKQGFTLVEAHWWRTFVAIMLGSAFLFVAAKILSALAFAITGSYVVEVIAILLAYVLFHSVFNSVLLVQFHDLQLRNAQRLPGKESVLVG